MRDVILNSPVFWEQLETSYDRVELDRTVANEHMNALDGFDTVADASVGEAGEAGDQKGNDKQPLRSFLLSQLRLFTLVTFFSFVSTHVSLMMLPARNDLAGSTGSAPHTAVPLSLSLSLPHAPHAGVDVGLVEDDRLADLVADAEEMFDRAFSGYMMHAFPMDDLKPISCTGSNSQGGMAITLIDSLDMLYLLRRDKDLRKAVLYISKSLSFDIDAKVHVFEVTIRALGGLLSGHVLLDQNKTMVPWYGGC